jgi:hypothetical protein
MTRARPLSTRRNMRWTAWCRPVSFPSPGCGRYSNGNATGRARTPLIVAGRRQCMDPARHHVPTRHGHCADGSGLAVRRADARAARGLEASRRAKFSRQQCCPRPWSAAWRPPDRLAGGRGRILPECGVRDRHHRRAFAVGARRVALREAARAIRAGDDEVCRAFSGAQKRAAAFCGPFSVCLGVLSTHPTRRATDVRARRFALRHDRRRGRSRCSFRRCSCSGPPQPSHCI